MKGMLNVIPTSNEEGEPRVLIFFSDLNEEAKAEVLELFGITCPEEANLDMNPLAIGKVIKEGYAS